MQSQRKGRIFYELWSSLSFLHIKVHRISTHLTATNSLQLPTAVFVRVAHNKTTLCGKIERIVQNLI